MASRFTGPLQNRDSAHVGVREWFRNLPIGQEPDLQVLWNDFQKTSDYNTSDWDITTTEAGAGDATEAITADAVNGELAITNDAGANDLDELQYNQTAFKLAPGKECWFEARVKSSDADKAGLFIGLATINDTTTFAGTTDSVSFRTTTSSAAMSFVTEDATVETTTAAVCTLADDTYVKLGFHWDGVSTVRAYVNRSLVATHTTTIEQTNAMSITLCIKNGETVAKILTVDYIYCASER